MANGYRRLEDVGAADHTDDTGASEYSVCRLATTTSPQAFAAPTDSVVQTTYSPTYYPGTGRARRGAADSSRAG